jgi:hypothetical protein
MLGRSERLAAAALLGVSLAACGGGNTSAPTSPKAPESAAAPSSDTSNERQLTRAQSIRLVSWADTFRSCMVSSGVSLGPLEKTSTHMRMELPASVTVGDVLDQMEACGERQGGPPHRSSLQYRPGEILLYLPKQCLLDPKVAAS